MEVQLQWVKEANISSCASQAKSAIIKVHLKTSSSVLKKLSIVVIVVARHVQSKIVILDMVS